MFSRVFVGVSQGGFNPIPGDGDILAVSNANSLIDHGCDEPPRGIAGSNLSYGLPVTALSVLRAALKASFSQMCV